MSYSPDTSSRAYKKALRLHNKSKKTPAAEVLPALREQEKQYKSRFPPPSLDDALDIRAVWQDPDDAAQVWKGSPDAVRIESIGCLSEERPHAKAYGIPELPGFLLLPGFLRPNEQRRLIKAILEDYAKAPNENNLDIHYILPEDGIWPSWKAYNDRKAKGYSEEPIIATKASASDMNVPGSSRVLIENPPASVENLAEFQALEKPPAAPSATLSPSPLSSLVHKLRWSNIGYFYHWGTKSYQFDRELTPIPSYIQQICKECVSSVNWSDVWRDGADMKAGRWDTEYPDWSEWPKTYEPDAGIINFYQLKDTLMAHVDRSELSSTSPLVSISLGSACVFLIGGLTREEKAIPIVLRSGDVVIMSGPRCRRAYHGVPRILEGSLPVYLKKSEDHDEDWDLIAEYLETTRLNINARQVFPTNFAYEEHGLGHLRNKIK